MAPNSRQLLQLFQSGESQAANQIFNRYVQRLLALARTRISAKLGRRIDADDVVQSAYRSFFVHAGRDEYQLEQSGDLWRLLARITLNKLLKQAEKHTAAKRSISAEATDAGAFDGLNTPEPTADEAAAITEELAIILQHLSPEQRDVLTRTLRAETVQQVSEATGKSPRTVRRLLQQIRDAFEQRLLSPAEPGPQIPAAVSEATTLRFQDFTLHQLLGAGGMGRVYRATDNRSGKAVAVKALRKSWHNSPPAVAQFLQEAEILTELNHPGIVQVHGLGRFPAGGYFIVMDYIDGENLEQKMHRDPLSPDAAVACFRNVAKALQHAHQHGIVHCDLKPANVLINTQNRVVVTDFGMAFVAARASANQIGAGGTAGYIAPEILTASSPPAAAADIYALGILLKNLLTSSGEAAHAAYESIIARCTMRHPADRYPDIAALLAALEQV